MKTKRILSIGLLTTGLVLSSASAVNADATPTPKSTTTYAAQLAVYKEAVIQYRVALVVNTINYRIALEKYQADWQAALAKYEAPYKAALVQYQTLQATYVAKLAPIATARKSMLDKADADFLAAIASAKNAAQKDLALRGRASAVSTASAVYKTAVAALGAAPVKPIKPPELTKPSLPVKPVSPTKPVPPLKPGTTKK